MIYIVGNTKENICKIGFSSNPYLRIKTLQSSVYFNLEIFDIFNGELEDERLIHSTLSNFRIKGEWYHLDEVLDKGINNISILDIDGIKIAYNKFGYINLHYFIHHLNTYNMTYLDSLFNFNSWKKSNIEFLESFKNNKSFYFDYSNWGHPFIVMEILRQNSIKTKMLAYNNMKSILGITKSMEQINMTLNLN